MREQGHQQGRQEGLQQGVAEGFQTAILKLPQLKFKQVLAKQARKRRGLRVVGEGLELRRGHLASPACHRETTWTCIGRRFHIVTNRVCFDCARPALW